MFMPVRVIADSAVGLDPDTAARLGIEVVPILVTVGDETYRDGEIGIPEMLRSGGSPTTAGPPPGAFAEAFARDGDAVVVTVAGSLSSTYRSAKLAAAEAAAGVAVVDSGTAAGAQALAAARAAEVARAGGTIDEVAAGARRVASRVRLIGALDTLEFLVRSGRVSGLVGGLAGWAGVRPLFELQGGRVNRLRPALSRRGARGRILSRWRRSRVAGAALHCAAIHAEAPERAAELLEAVRAEAEISTEMIGGFGPGMVAHTGPGVVGLAWWWEEP
jgi:DegV family protein with EDD domain